MEKIESIEGADQKDLIGAAKSGNRLETLIALRDLLAERLQHAGSDRDVASMSRRLIQTIAEIDTLQKEKEVLERNPKTLNQLRKELSKMQKKDAV